MTIIEISSPPDPNQQKSQEGEGSAKSDRAVGGDQPIASSSKISKKVSFGKPSEPINIPIIHENAPNVVEQECLEHLKAVFDEVNEPLFRQIFKSTCNFRGDAQSAQDLMPQLVEKYFDEVSSKNTANSVSMHAQTVPEGPVTIDNEPPQLFPAYPGPIGPMPLSAADREAKDFSKAMENSLKDHVPPAEKLRGDVSVGLENVGQTCWFGVIAQVLFHLPKYRKTIYENTPPEWVVMSKNHTNENFTERDLLVRMRTLFAEMDAGNRKSVDPKPVLDVIEELVKTKQPQNQATKLIGTQQDASELLEYISDWVEKGLQFAHHEIHTRNPLHISTAPPPPQAPEAMPSASSEQMECSPAVPQDSQEEEKMVVDPPQEDHVFAVPALPDRVLPQTDEKRTALDAWADSPLKDVFHGTSLTRSMNADNDCAPNRVSTSMPIFRADISQRDIHDALAHHGFSDKSETWFENLPGVLILTLNRFAYDKGISKIHTAFDVPPKLYMDRYLYRNMAVVKEIQEKKTHLMQRLRAVSAKLKGYTHFPVGGGEGNLKDVLDAARAFFSGKAQRFSTEDRELPSPSEISEEYRLRFLQLFDQMGQNCVLEENEYSRQRDELMEDISQLFEIPDLQQEEYILHAVVIHEGEANVGHYYTCIRGDPKPANREVWQKFNDRHVDIVSWDQIQLEAGGRFKTGCSAYCLVYVKASDVTLHSDAYVPFKQRLDVLPSDLAGSVYAKNAELCDEINRYEEAMQVVVVERPAPLQKANAWLYDDYENVKSPLSTLDFSQGLAMMTPKFYERAAYLFDQSAHYRRKELDYEADMKQTLLMTGNSHLKGYLLRRYPEFQSYKSVQEAVVTSKMSPEEMKIIYETTIFEWPLFHYANESKHDVRADVLSFWKATGIGLPARVFRLIVVKILSMSRSLYPPPSSDSSSNDEYTFLETQAKQELSQVPSVERLKNSSWNYYNAYHLRIMANYALVKLLWGLIKVVLRELFLAKGIKFDANAANDYVDAWMKPLKQSFLTLRIYDTVKDDLDQQAGTMHCCIDPNICIMEQSLLRGTMLYSFLKLFDFVANVLVKCREQPNEAQTLLDSQMFNHISAALNRISKWSMEGCEMSIKVVASVTECLNCARDVLQEAGGPAVTVIKNLYHAIDPNSTLSVTHVLVGLHVTSMETEILDARNIRMELGLSDDQDAMCTIARLLEDISAAISRFFQ